jgi:hypothetical protein
VSRTVTIKLSTSNHKYEVVRDGFIDQPPSVRLFDHYEHARQYASALAQRECASLIDTIGTSPEEKLLRAVFGGEVI